MYLYVVILATTFAIYNILRLYGVFEFSKKNSKVISIIEEDRKHNKSRKREIKKLAFYAQITETFRGIIMNAVTYENHQYFIQRLDIRSEVLNRQLTPEEVRGKYFLPVILGIICLPLGLFFPLLFLAPIAALICWSMYQTIYRQRIHDEDLIIDDWFIDMYLLMYSQLRRGSRARLQNVVESYINSTETQQDRRVKDVMLKLAHYLLNLLSLYEDHVAVPKLKDIYRSATIINFCNVASQALNGIDNADNLLTFKMSLTERKLTMMRKRSEKMIARGERSIYLIYVILFIFIAVGWYSKLPTDMFNQMF